MAKASSSKGKQRAADSGERVRRQGEASGSRVQEVGDTLEEWVMLGPEQDAQVEADTVGETPAEEQTVSQEPLRASDGADAEGGNKPRGNSEPVERPTRAEIRALLAERKEEQDDLDDLMMTYIGDPDYGTDRLETWPAFVRERFLHKSAENQRAANREVLYQQNAETNAVKVSRAGPGEPLAIQPHESPVFKKREAIPTKMQPELYDGKSSVKLDIYIIRCEAVFRFAPDDFVLEEQRVRWATGFLDVEPQKQYAALREKDPILVNNWNWAAYVKWLKDSLLDPRARAIIKQMEYNKVMQKKNQSIQQFVTYLETIEKDLPPQNEEQKFQNLFHKLEPEMRLKLVHAGNITEDITRERLILLVKMQESVIRTIAAHEAPSNNNKRKADSDANDGAANKKSTRSNKRSQKKSGNTNNNNGGGNKNSGESSSNSKARTADHSDKTCHYCSKVGHIQADCYKKKNDLARENGSSNFNQKNNNQKKGAAARAAKVAKVAKANAEEDDIDSD